MPKTITQGVEANINKPVLLKEWVVETPLGMMLSISDDSQLYLLTFLDSKRLAHQVDSLTKHLNSTIIRARSSIITFLIDELYEYFNGNLKSFSTPIALFGTSFQKLVWKHLLMIPYGESRSYTDQAQLIGKPLAYRAVANANAANQVSIIVPCHRIICNDRTLGGYSGSVNRKKWLLDHEFAYKTAT